MKTLLVVFSICALGVSWGQRNMDLTVTITDPADNAEIVENQTAFFTIQLTNNGSENLVSADTLNVYMEINGTPIIFQPGNTDHMVRTGYTINAGSTFNFSFPMIFTDSYENTVNQMCIEVLPVNAADPILETVPGDNTDCVTFTVVANNAGLNEWTNASSLAYPNPADESFAIKEIGNATVSVVALDGSIVPAKVSANGNVDCKSWPTGTYILQVQNNEEISTQRMIISH